MYGLKMCAAIWRSESSYSLLTALQPNEFLLAYSRKHVQADKISR